MARFERPLTIDHEIGPGGELRIRTIDGHVRLSGTDGTVAHVVATYRVRAADDEAADRAIEAAEVRVDRSTGRLEIDTHERRWSPFDVLGQLLTGTRVRVDFDVEVPRGASVQIDAVNADVSAQGLRGRQRFKTVSGDVREVDVAGTIDADSVSGRIEVFGPHAIDIKAHSVSGRIQVAARDLARVQVGTTSGGVDLAGTLEPGVDHVINSVSGGVRLATDAGVTVDVRTMSGGIRSEVPHRLESTNGSRRVIVGDGRARLRIQAVSAGVDIMRQGATPGAGDSAHTPGSPAEASPEVRSDDAPSVPPPPPTQESGSIAPVEAPSPELEILRALERGEIGVEEAAARLSAARNETSRQDGVTSNA